ncbi:MAG: site-specific integrase, partial [bacterium]|nr:site-specific integrase [bacterium]
LAEIMSRPIGQKTDTEPLTKVEYYQLLTHLAGWHRLLFELLWETGIRIGEAMTIERKHLHDNGIDITREKRKDHLVEFIPLTGSLYSRLRIHALGHKDVRVFPYTAAAAWLALKKAAERSGVRKTMHPHLFRHGMGFRARQDGADIAEVQRLLGHKDMSSTQRYFKATQAEINERRARLNR